MSAKRRQFVDDRNHDRDPYDIIPEGFLLAYNASSISEALKKAEQAPSTTPEGELRRCPDCGSIKVLSKPGHREIPNKRSEKYKCGECGGHFDTPDDPKDKSAPGEQSTLDECTR